MPSIKKSELISPLQRLSIIIPFFLYFFFKRNYREPEKLANRDCARGGKRKRRRRKIKIFGYFFFFFSSPTVGGRLLALLAGPHPRREWVSAGDTDRWPMDQSTRRSLSLALVALASRLRRRHDPPESPPTQKEKKISAANTHTHTNTTQSDPLGKTSPKNPSFFLHWPSRKNVLLVINTKQSTAAHTPRKLVFFSSKSMIANEDCPLLMIDLRSYLKVWNDTN